MRWPWFKTIESNDTRGAIEESTLDAFAVAVGMLGIRSFARMFATRGGVALEAVTSAPAAAGTLVAIVPVLDERARLGPCLAGLCAQGSALASIVVVDGGSRDGTQTLVRDFAARDPRVVLVDAAPIPRDWNGKAWGLATGLAASDPNATWIACVDADVRPAPAFATSLLAHGARHRLDAFSAAPRLALSGALEALLHPALLTTLVYRYGLPGHIARERGRVQANGQCFVADRALLVRSGAFAFARRSRCEDVTVARRLTALGARVGFYEGGAVASVAMYASARDCWRNWPRSLGLRDAESTPGEVALAFGEMTLVGALPLAYVLVALALRADPRRTHVRVFAALAAARIGVLLGTKRAYDGVPWTYWLSPLTDVPAALAVVASIFVRRPVWRGRPLVSEGSTA